MIKIDLTGNKFGMLTVISPSERRGARTMWLCRCDCGNGKILNGQDLKSGRTKSCGCLRKHLISDMGGKRFGRLLVVKNSADSTPGKVRWDVVCDCGTKKSVSGSGLRAGTVTSCGCYGREKTSSAMQKDISGKKFGKLTAIRRTVDRSSSGCVRWECECECGKVIFVPSSSLVSGHTKSCGCLKHNCNQKIWNTKKEMFAAPVSDASVLFNRIPLCDHPKTKGGIAHVKCKMCGESFPPGRESINRRIKAYEGKVRGENNFYCSDKCRSMCPVFGASTDPYLRKPKKETDAARSCSKKILKKLQCDEGIGSYCEKCGDSIDIELHHTITVAENPSEAKNPAGHMLLCYGCHNVLHNSCR